MDRVAGPRGDPAEVQAHLNALTKPPGSLGRLEELALQVGVVLGDPPPALDAAVVFVFAADHGVSAQGVSAYPAEVTAQMCANFSRGGAAINVLARVCGAEVRVVDVGVGVDIAGLQRMEHRKVRAGTRDLSEGPAMTEDEVVEALAVGVAVAHTAGISGAEKVATPVPVKVATPAADWAVNPAAERASGTPAETAGGPVAGDADGMADPSDALRNAWIVGVGEMGIANTTAAAAVTACLTGAPACAVVGRGTGVDDAGLARKRGVVERAVARVACRDDPAEVLGEVGGLEIAAMVGAMIGSAARGALVLVDGFISSAAALAARRLCPALAPYLIASHRSAEPGHAVALDALGLAPLLDLEMRLGEGSGSALAIPIVRAAGALLREMATFESAGISGPSGNCRAGDPVRGAAR